MTPRESPRAAFDEYADEYTSTLEEGLSLSGEGAEYFARGRVQWLKTKLLELGVRPRKAIDFGCGTGSSTPLLHELLGLDAVVGVDVSRQSVEVARKRHERKNVSFFTLDEHAPVADLDLAFCNGVFHHIPPAERAAAVAYVWRALRPGGIWAFWENNPLNPGTQWVMYRLPFDRDAVKLTAWQAQKLLESGGFHRLRTDYLFIFPRALGFLRPLEQRLVRFPLGGQYLVLCRKPETSPA